MRRHSRWRGGDPGRIPRTAALNGTAARNAAVTQHRTPRRFLPPCHTPCAHGRSESIRVGPRPPRPLTSKGARRQRPASPALGRRLPRRPGRPVDFNTPLNPPTRPPTAVRGARASASVVHRDAPEQHLGCALRSAGGGGPPGRSVARLHGRGSSPAIERPGRDSWRSRTETMDSSESNRRNDLDEQHRPTRPTPGQAGFGGQRDKNSGLAVGGVATARQRAPLRRQDAVGKDLLRKRIRTMSETFRPRGADSSSAIQALHSSPAAGSPPRPRLPP